ncbi:MAG TPA: cytochrome-c oxidase, cbb3-type subunit II [SAR86 cluster bacterium]|jgi:cytochrome c oxidase cbb3-type subunit 2|nr:cytochrome-c oxidase, cbb3-type subunit II [Gammaproteobacteria bacterium]MDP6181380.1 cytochrome-c oxidase, cbb3-type subunit II [SAR86 cluster bacterium]HJM15370.1 cytochrome-c oxidase, cbb3-type subunit II [SAR86 cluster bacterium]HJM59620.1 cytochrome-c oxidase, cbb3-type subunit II [SAR86 cluster bacterium]|tara:strand:+ start:1403 stop:2005 length:603 start_codon:yes stop_codon:yes gene_type:complete
MNNLIEKNIFLMLVLILLGVSFGGMVEIIPLMSQKILTEPIDNLEPLTALELEGRDIYIREGCNVCHSQMIRPLRAEVERYGHYSVAGESVYNHPFLWGSKRTGPDLARVGGLYSDDWHKIHLMNPRSVVPKSNMPAFPWLFENTLNRELSPKKLRALQILGVPYTDEEINKASEDLINKTEADAVVAYLQQLGTVIKKR